MPSTAENELNFNFKNFALLIFSIQDGNQNALKFKREMDKRNINHTLVKPFPHLMNKSVKLIWYLGHDCNSHQIMIVLKAIIPEK